MMKKIIYLAAAFLCMACSDDHESDQQHGGASGSVTEVLMTMAAWGQSSAAVDTLTPAQDSVSIGSHTEFAAAKISDDNVTKAEGDSAYMRNDYASAIQIYESLLKNGGAAEVYYNLGNS